MENGRDSIQKPDDQVGIDDILSRLPSEEELADFGVVVTEKRDDSPKVTSKPEPAEKSPGCSSERVVDDNPKSISESEPAEMSTVCSSAERVDDNPKSPSEPKPEKCTVCSFEVCDGSQCQFPSLEETQRLPRISLRKRRSGQGSSSQPGTPDTPSPTQLKEAEKPIPPPPPSPSSPTPQNLPTPSSSHQAEQSSDTTSTEQTEASLRTNLPGSGRWSPSFAEVTKGTEEKEE